MADACRVCNAAAAPFATAQVLGKYSVEYQQCSDCQFIQTETPYWLDEAYNDAIISTDLGLVGRNQKFSRIASRLLRHLFPQAETGVDYGGGYGMFTRMMRDLGHGFGHYDPFCENLFAKGYVVALEDQRRDFLTAFEVWEHMAEPHQDVAKMDRMADHWLVSTMLVPEPRPMPDQWWYYALDGGQHVALWTKRALQAVASRYGRRLVTTRKGLHLFSSTAVNSNRARRILSDRGGWWLDRTRKRKSLLQSDYKTALAAITEQQTQQAA